MLTARSGLEPIREHEAHQTFHGRAMRIKRHTSLKLVRKYMLEKRREIEEKRLREQYLTWRDAYLGSHVYDRNIPAAVLAQYVGSPIEGATSNADNTNAQKSAPVIASHCGPTAQQTAVANAAPVLHIAPLVKPMAGLPTTHSSATAKLLMHARGLGYSGPYHVVDDGSDDFDVVFSSSNNNGVRRRDTNTWTAHAPSLTAAMGAAVGAACVKAGLGNVWNTAQLYGQLDCGPGWSLLSAIAGCSGFFAVNDSP